MCTYVCMCSMCEMGAPSAYRLCTLLCVEANSIRTYIQYVYNVCMYTIIRTYIQYRYVRSMMQHYSSVTQSTCAPIDCHWPRSRWRVGSWVEGDVHVFLSTIQNSPYHHVQGYRSRASSTCYILYIGSYLWPGHGVPVTSQETQQCVM